MHVCMYVYRFTFDNACVYIRAHVCCDISKKALNIKDVFGFLFFFNYYFDIR